MQTGVFTKEEFSARVKELWVERELDISVKALAGSVTQETQFQRIRNHASSQTVGAFVDAVIEHIVEGPNNMRALNVMQMAQHAVSQDIDMAKPGIDYHLKIDAIDEVKKVIPELAGKVRKERVPFKTEDIDAVAAAVYQDLQNNRLPAFDPRHLDDECRGALTLYIRHTQLKFLNAATYDESKYGTVRHSLRSQVSDIHGIGWGAMNFEMQNLDAIIGQRLSERFPMLGNNLGREGF